jgi:hypothetical protein
MFGFDDWLVATAAYCMMAFLTFLPILAALLRQVKLKPGGDSFADSPHFSNEAKERLEQHYTRIQGTLIFWKNKAEWNRRFHYYTVCWTLLISLVIPVMVTFVDIESYARIFLIIIALHSAVILGFHRALKIENNYKAFRYGESEFYDMYRRMLDRPESFGGSEEERLEAYFIETERIRRYVRSAEIDNFPGLEERSAQSQSPLRKK